MGVPSSAPHPGPPEISLRLCGQVPVVQGPSPGPIVPGTARAAVLPFPSPACHARQPPDLPRRVHRHQRPLGLDLPCQGILEIQGLGRGSRLSDWPSNTPPLTWRHATRGLIKPDGGKT